MEPGIPKFRKESRPEGAKDNEDQFIHTFFNDREGLEKNPFGGGRR